MTKLTIAELERIYELTYKYGWLTTEERQEGWLPDAAYMEKARISGDLGPLLNTALDKIAGIYGWWLDNHTKDAWVETMQTAFFQDPEDLQYLVINFDNWGEFTNAVYIITSEIGRSVPNTGEDLFTLAIETDDNDIANIFVMLEEYYDVILEKSDKILGKLYNLWAKAFGVAEAYPLVKRGYQDVTSAQGGSIDDRIVGFQIGLTTAHSTGTMADHLIEGAEIPGAGKQVLDDLSSGPHLADWSKDLAGVLGHDPGASPGYDNKPTYYEPELGQHLGKAIKILSDNEKIATFNAFWRRMAGSQLDLTLEY